MGYILACDVDGVVVDMFSRWYEYLRETTGLEVRKDFACKFYDLHTPFSEAVSQELAWGWWKSFNLYDDVIPMEGAVEGLKKFKESGFDIVFVSHVEGVHGKSKHDMLREFFPFMDGFIATREKNYVRATVAIDDRLKHLASYPADVITVQMMTPHLQDVVYHPDFVLEDWKNEFAIDEIIKVAKRTQLHTDCSGLGYFHNDTMPYNPTR